MQAAEKSKNITLPIKAYMGLYGVGDAKDNDELHDVSENESATSLADSQESKNSEDSKVSISKFTF
jgi:hypothetical protein